ncbi:hypothetical protein D3C87_1035580 [compost metagenome]
MSVNLSSSRKPTDWVFPSDTVEFDDIVVMSSQKAMTACDTGAGNTPCPGEGGIRFGATTSLVYPADVTLAACAG